MDMAYRKIFINALSYLIIGLIFVYLYKEFRSHWASIHTYDLKVDAFIAFLSFAAILTTYLLTTYGWFVALNSLSPGNPISFTDSVAIINTSNLTKYIPGKVWSFALQTYWLVKAGFKSSLIAFTFILNIFTLIMTFLILGLFYLALSPGTLPLKVVVSIFILLVVLDILFMRYNSTLFNALISVINKTLKRDIQYFHAPMRLLLYMQLVHFLSAFCYGMSAYLVCLGIGFNITGNSIYTLMSSMILSDVIGFLAIVVPGGLGVREGVMYLLLKGDAFGALALLLPIATRIVGMFIDIFLGVVGCLLLKHGAAPSR